MAQEIKTTPDGVEGGVEEMVRRKAMESEEKKRQKAEADRKAQEEYDLRARAVVETALAYYRRGVRQQYDSVGLNRDPRRMAANRRATDRVSPEDATMDHVSYFVCSTFTFNVYYEAIGYAVCGNENTCSTRNMLAENSQAVVYHYIENCGETIDEAVESIRRILRPADIIVGDRAGHALLYLGDCLGDGHDYVAHSWGGKYNVDTGVDRYEKAGTIRLDDAFECCFNRVHKGPGWPLHKRNEIAVIRPLRVAKEENYPLTANARARLAHTGLDYDRRVSVSAYATLPRGAQVTVTVTLKNTAKTDYAALPVTERVPQGTSLVCADGAARDGDTLAWSLDLAAGEEKTVCFTVATDENTPDTVVFDGGTAAGIRGSRPAVHMGGKPLSPAAVARLRGLAVHCGETEIDDPAAFGREFYQKVLGLPVPIPTADELLDGCFERFTAVPDGECVDDDGEPAELLRLKEAPAMMPHGWLGGKWVATTPEQGRILEFAPDRVAAGDVIVAVKGLFTAEREDHVWVSLEAGAFAFCEGGRLAVTKQDITWPLLSYDFFVLLRPQSVCG